MPDFISKTFNLLGSQDQKLIRASEEALASSYAPYSGFHVGVALLMEDGTLITGSNQENVAYPSGLCAERVALFNAASQHPGKRIVDLAVVAKRSHTTPLIPVTPCGACRQVMLEMETRQGNAFRVLMLWKDNEWIIAPSAQSLLPFSFTSDNLL